MSTLQNDVALIVGAGDGLSASIARRFARAGMRIALAARSISKLSQLAAELEAGVFACDAADADQVARLCKSVEHDMGAPEPAEPA